VGHALSCAVSATNPQGTTVATSLDVGSRGSRPGDPGGRHDSRSHGRPRSAGTGRTRRPGRLSGGPTGPAGARGPAGPKGTLSIKLVSARVTSRARRTVVVELSSSATIAGVELTLRDGHGKTIARGRGTVHRSRHGITLKAAHRVKAGTYRVTVGIPLVSGTRVNASGGRVRIR
jgi:hypothetical protein